MFEKTGIPSMEMIMEKFPSIERINKGAVAVIECYKEIPCNPCETACKLWKLHGLWNLPEQMPGVGNHDSGRF